MNDQIRVPMKQGHSWIAEGDVDASMSDTPKVGRRFNLDISEDALARIGRAGLAHAVEDLGRAIAYRHQGDVEAAVYSYLRDRSWAEPIIKKAIQGAVRETILSMLIPMEAA